MLKEFREFIMRGNVLDLAIAVVMGAAFTAIVNSLVEHIITPIISAVTGNADVSNLTFQLGRAEITYGFFLQAIIDFLLIAVILFLVIRLINRFPRRKKEVEPEPEVAAPTAESYLAEIRDLLVAQNAIAIDNKKSDR